MLENEPGEVAGDQVTDVQILQTTGRYAYVLLLVSSLRAGADLICLHMSTAHTAIS